MLMTTRTLPSGETVDAGWADAAGPDSRLHVNSLGMFGRVDGGPWRRAGSPVAGHRIAEWLDICDRWADVVDAFDLDEPEPTR